MDNLAVDDCVLTNPVDRALTKRFLSGRNARVFRFTSLRAWTATASYTRPSAGC